MGVFNICVLLTVLVVVSGKPIDLKNIATTDNVASVSIDNFKSIESTDDAAPVNIESNNGTEADNELNANNETNWGYDSTRSLRNQIRPGIIIGSYAVELTPNVNAGTFFGRAIIEISITDAATREDPIMLYVRDLDISSVTFSILGGSILYAADYDVDDDDGILEIETGFIATSYNFHIEYTGSLSVVGKGFFAGSYDGGTYVAMNLHPTNARRVFPCMDEPTEVSIISFTFNNMEYTNLVSNSLLEENSVNQFRALQGPPHLWGMVGHNFANINIPIANVLLHSRPGLFNQDSQAAAAINFYFTNLNEWTNKPYFEILLNQNTNLNIFALPDISTDWHALSTIGIWEGNMFMEITHSIKQRKTALFEIANAMARQWFGFVVFPENWRHEWVTNGLASYAAYEMMRLFQNDPTGLDVTLLDVNTLFVTDVIQESLLLDAYVNAPALEPENDLFEEDEIRDHIHSKLVKYKAPALMRMMRIVLGEQDFIQSAGRALLNGRALQTVNSFYFIDAVNSDWFGSGNNNVDDLEEYLEDWIYNTGYPLLHVGMRQGGVLITQERFGFANLEHRSYLIPITYTTSVNPDFNNYEPVMMSDATVTLNFFLDEEDWVLFNIQGQGYYRVNYDNELWERIIEALEDPDRREEIHPLNRATLIDDALNLARAGNLDYDIAFRVVLTMEHETEYAPWKAFVRNMDFLRHHLVALVSEDEDLDQDIYLRMVRRTIGAVERELGFYPDITLSEPAMQTLTRGLVMDHACRANYQPCIAAAVDWFYDPDNSGVVNPNIPHEIRPAVYCTMVREGDDDVISALYARLDIEPTMYERSVILESLACSQDDGFIRTYLEETLAVNSPWSVEERNRIFMAVVRSSFDNAFNAINFISMRTMEIRNMYGGAEKLEAIIHEMAEYMAGFFLATEYRIWVNAQNNNLDDSQLTALRALEQVNANLDWETAHMDYVYEWIDENSSSTTVISIVALCLSIMIAILNQ
uniref:Glutamine aminopeptidase-like protein 11 n=1 Tax=Achaea janata TaxID=378752 RepID=A0A286LQ00_ACHJA|nr:glutamine aminopeptidase-like protein 11 [Achaea janata]